MTATVIIITLNRPECVRTCLSRLAAQTRSPDEVVVVDASSDIRTRAVVAECPGVRYLRNDAGFGRMTTSRNIGVAHSVGDVVAFLDDDAYAHEGWLEALLATYTADDVGGVGGRALNGQPGEGELGSDCVGRLLPNGTLTGHFAADPGRTLEVDHVIGCNMSYRRVVIEQLGGFREDYTGISGVREDTDMCLRVRRLGYRLLFNPRAVVDHVGAPQATGRRFDARYRFYASCNHALMLLRNFGLGSRTVWRYLPRAAVAPVAEFVRKSGGAAARCVADICGTAVGVVRGIYILTTHGTDPVRRHRGVGGSPGGSPKPGRVRPALSQKAGAR